MRASRAVVRKTAQAPGQLGNAPAIATNVLQIAAPYGGWNARDPLSAMAATDAIQLDNLIPSVGGLRIRGGNAQHADGMTGPVESLMVYSPPLGTDKMFAATDAAIYDVTAADAATVVSGVTVTSGRWQQTMFATAAGSYLICANGVDKIWTYDGSTWTALSATGSGFAPENIVAVYVHAGRLWLVENNALHVWYLDVSSIGGTATKLPIGQFCKKGGHIVVMASWTRDGGEGMDDVAAFITSKGEAVLYSGTDPASPTTWNKVGTFSLPEPVGRRCYAQAGADLGMISSQGVVPFSSILPLAQSGAAKVAATDKISGAFSKAYNGSANYFGWQLVEYAKERLMIVNVPIQERGTTHQYVMDTQSGAWCRWTGMNAGCWAVMGDRLFFGGQDGKVYRYGSGATTDLGQDINAVSISAYTNCGTPNRKTVKMARPLFTGPDGYLPAIVVRSDYDTNTVNFTATPSSSSGALWDEAEWDEAEWALSVTSSARWQSSQAEGSVFSIALAVSVSDQFRFDAIDLVIETAGVI